MYQSYMRASRCTRETQRSVLAIRAASEVARLECRSGLIAACLGTQPATATTVVDRPI